MENYNIRAYVELFHLLFIQQLSQSLDKRLYALKGGCNLRFFLGSIRYSEDIDIDVHTVAAGTLKKTIDKILTGTSFEQILKTKKISIDAFSAPKQTATTQRWKIQIKTPAQSLSINTKIEFSRRDTGLNAITEAIPRELIVAYKLRPFFLSHYTVNVALGQKIKALILRTQTQARDIFDIYHLIQSYETKKEYLFTKNEVQLAIHNAMSISFPEFKSQVISYLGQEYQSQYNDKNTWDEIVATVCEYLDGYLP